MENLQKGFIVPLLLALIALLLIGGGAYVYTQKKQENPPVMENVTLPQATSTAQTSNSQTPKKYSISKCGIEVTIKTNQAVKTKDISAGRYDFVEQRQYSIESVPKSDLIVECYARSVRSPKNVSFYLSVQSDGSSEVNKNNYPVFDQQTISSITKLYSAKNRGYREGSETIGFENKDWMYTFSFLNPKQARNHDTFIISVVSPTAN